MPCPLSDYVAYRYFLLILDKFAHTHILMSDIKSIGIYYQKIGGKVLFLISIWSKSRSDGSRGDYGDDGGG